jgi:hypothetical protein
MRAILGAVLCLASVPARADVVVRPGVPFTATQLEAAIEVRGGAKGLDIEVWKLFPDRLVVLTPGGRWEIEIGAARGAAAARVVALHVVEVAVHAAPVSIVVVAAPGQVAPSAAEVRTPASSGRAGGPRIATLAVGALGTRGSDFASLGGALEVSYAGPWIFGAGLSWQREQTIGVMLCPPCTGHLFRGRAVAGVSSGPVELVASGFAGRISLYDTGGRIRRWSTGISAEVRLVLPISTAWAVMIAAGTERFREVIAVAYDAAATPRMTLTAGIGVAWRGATR